MTALTTPGDQRLLREIRRRNGATIDDLLASAGVTRVALRQRLIRLMNQGLLQRRAVRQGRGRPCHYYALTDRADRLFASQLAELAASLWQQFKQIEDEPLRQRLLRRISDQLAGRYAHRVSGAGPAQRLRALQRVLSEQGIEADLDQTSRLPVLRQHDCPYGKLPLQDPDICALEGEILQRLLGYPVRLKRCRILAGQGGCCEFEVLQRADKRPDHRQSVTQGD